MGLLKALGGIASNIGKAAGLVIGAPMALAGTVVIGSIKSLVDIAAKGTAYWIKNNFTGESTLFNASMALTTFSNGLGSFSKNWNGFWFAGAKYCGSKMAESLEEVLNISGWASTGAFDGGNNDQQDLSIYAGEEAFKKYNERRAANASTKKKAKESDFDIAAAIAEKWLTEGIRIQENKALPPAEKTLKIKEWFEEPKKNKTLRAILRIVGVGDTVQNAQRIFEKYDAKIADLEAKIVKANTDKIVKANTDNESESDPTALEKTKSDLMIAANTPSEAMLKKMLNQAGQAFKEALPHRAKPNSTVGKAKATAVQGVRVRGSTAA